LSLNPESHASSPSRYDFTVGWSPDLGASEANDAVRALLLVLHRWAGLTIALALVVTGLTGAILPYQDQLRSLTAPNIWNVQKPTPDARPLSGLQLMRLVETFSGGIVSYIELVPKPDHAFSVFVSPGPDGSPADYDQVYVDPYTSKIRAAVRYGDLKDGAINLVPFLVTFHYSLAAGPWGSRLLGLAALIWCGVCVAGFFLTLTARNGNWRGTFRRWRLAWSIRRDKGRQILAFDLHRATGLWLWPAMLVFAWSAVAFNLDTVHQPVQRFFGARGLYQPIHNPAPASGQAMSPEKAEATGRTLMAKEAQRRGFVVRAPEALSFRPYDHVTGYYARTSLDGPTDQGSTVVWFDEVSGREVAFEPPFGTTAADAIDKATRMLHTTALFGWPYKLFVSFFGLLTAATAIAGIYMWVRRSGKRSRKMVRAKVPAQ
jgi:uncharacterized iron-regulated membrane protein